MSLLGVLQAAYSFEPGGGTRALSMLSFGFDFWRGGLDPAVFRTTNLIIHAITTVVMAFFLRSILIVAGWSLPRAARMALLLTVLWALHPLQVSSVLYIVQRMQTLCTLFTLLALFFYVRGRMIQVGGGTGRQEFLLTLFCGCIAFASKEDAVLLPAYTLVLELTILQFGAARPELENMWRKGYLVFFLAGFAFFSLYVVPHHWSWEAYPGRDFSSAERLMTQGRVLIMYMGQIIFPMPQSLSFYYDDFSVSRGLLQPVSTLFALILNAGLLFWAWRWRQRRKLFSFGVLMFFAGHFVTSNVIGLELAFEHRNHLPSIGLLLALIDLACFFWIKFPFLHRIVSRPVAGGVLVVMLCTIASVTWARAVMWGQPLEFARAGTDYAPRSARAWLQKCNTYFELSGSKPDSPWLEKAIRTCEEGVDIHYSASILNNVVLFKTIQKTVTENDWQRLLARLRTVPMSVENKRLAWGIVSNVVKGIELDEKNVLAALKVIVERAHFEVHEYVSFGYFVLGYTSQSDEAYAYLERAVDSAEPGDPDILTMLENLEQGGYEELGRSLRERVMKQGKLQHSS